MKKALRITVTVLLLAVFLYSGYRFVFLAREYQEGETAYEEIMDECVTISTVSGPVPENSGSEDAKAAAAGESEADDADQTEAVKTYYLPTLSAQSDEGQAAEGQTEEEQSTVISIDFQALKRENADIEAWLYSPGTTINYPVLQSADNKDYLHRLPDGTYNFCGSLFIDCQCDGFNGLNTIIYGHNMKDGNMFCSLLNYKNTDYYAKHDRLYLLTENEAYVLYPIAGFVTPSDSDSYAMYDDQASLQNYLKDCATESSFASGTDISQVDRIITLSTCEYSNKKSRYVLVCQPVLIEQ